MLAEEEARLAAIADQLEAAPGPSRTPVTVICADLQRIVRLVWEVMR